MAVETETIDPAKRLHVGQAEWVRLQRKSERQQHTLAQMNRLLERARRRLRDREADCGFAISAIDHALYLSTHEAPMEAAVVLEDALFLFRHDSDEAHQRTLARARKHDQALVVLRGQVSALHGALTRAKGTIRVWHGLGLTQTKGEEAHGWALYQGSPEMQQINRALGE